MIWYKLLTLRTHVLRGMVLVILEQSSSEKLYKLSFQEFQRAITVVSLVQMKLCLYHLPEYTEFPLRTDKEDDRRQKDRRLGIRRSL